MATNNFDHDYCELGRGDNNNNRRDQQQLTQTTKFFVKIDDKEILPSLTSSSSSTKVRLFKANKLSDFFAKLGTNNKQLAKKNLFGSKLEDASDEKDIFTNEPLHEKLLNDEKFLKYKRVIDSLHRKCDYGKTLLDLKVDDNNNNNNSQLTVFIDYLNKVNQHTSGSKLVEQIETKFKLVSFIYEIMHKNRSISDSYVCSDRLNQEIAFSVWRNLKLIEDGHSASNIAKTSANKHDSTSKNSAPTVVVSASVDDATENRVDANNETVAPQTALFSMPELNANANDSQNANLNLNLNLNLFDEPVTNLVDNELLNSIYRDVLNSTNLMNATNSSLEEGEIVDDLRSTAVAAAAAEAKKMLPPPPPQPPRQQEAQPEVKSSSVAQNENVKMDMAEPCTVDSNLTNVNMEIDPVEDVTESASTPLQKDPRHEHYLKNLTQLVVNILRRLTAMNLELINSLITRQNYVYNLTPDENTSLHLSHKQQELYLTRLKDRQKTAKQLFGQFKSEQFRLTFHSDLLSLIDAPTCKTLIDAYYVIKYTYDKFVDDTEHVLINHASSLEDGDSNDGTAPASVVSQITATTCIFEKGVNFFNSINEFKLFMEDFLNDLVFKQTSNGQTAICLEVIRTVLKIETVLIELKSSLVYQADDPRVKISYRPKYADQLAQIPAENFQEFKRTSAATNNCWIKPFDEKAYKRNKYGNFRLLTSMDHQFWSAPGNSEPIRADIEDDQEELKRFATSCRKENDEKLVISSSSTSSSSSNWSPPPTPAFNISSTSNLDTSMQL